MSKITDLILKAIAPRAKGAAFLVQGLTLIGDSIMYGIAPHFTNVDGYPIHNLTIPGDTARNAWVRFPYTIRSSADVLIQVGTNDLTNGVDPVPYIKMMTEYALKEGREVFLTGILPRSDIPLTLDYNREIAKLAEPGVWILPTINLNLASADYFLFDGLHPTQDTSKMLANLITTSLRRAGLGSDPSNHSAS